MPQGPAPTAPTTQTGGPPQAPPVNNQNIYHQNAMAPPTDPAEHLLMAKAQELLKQRRRQQNLAWELWQVQVLLLSLLIHRRTL